MTGLIMPWAAGVLSSDGVGDPPVVTYEDIYKSTSNSRTYTFSGASFGSDVAGRGIIVLVTGGGENRDWVSCTIGGVSATEIIQHGNPNLSNATAMYYAEPSGTSGTVVCNSDPAASSMARAIISVLSITGHDPTATFTYETETTTGTATSVSANLPENGVCIVAVAENTNNTFSWTNATELFDQNVGGETCQFSAAVRTASSAETGTTITATSTGSSRTSIIAASFAPA